VTVEAAAVVAVAGAAGKNLQFKRISELFATVRGALPSAAIVLPVRTSGVISALGLPESCAFQQNTQLKVLASPM
jgi:hypothetical protein